MMSTKVGKNISNNPCPGLTGGWNCRAARGDWNTGPRDVTIYRAIKSQGRKSLCRRLFLGDGGKEMESRCDGVVHDLTKT